MATSTEDEIKSPPAKIIETDRLRLRTLSISDVDAAMPLLARQDVMKWTSRLPIHERSVAERWIGDRALGADVFNFAIELRHPNGDDERKNVFVGICGSFHPPACGYMIHPDHAGKGYATEALRAFIPAYFERYRPDDQGSVGFDYITGMTDPENYASMRILEKCGFTRIGVVENDFENPSMGLRSSVVFRLARPGKTLEEIGAAELEIGPARGDDAPVTPPVQ